MLHILGFIMAGQINRKKRKPLKQEKEYKERNRFRIIFYAGGPANFILSISLINIHQTFIYAHDWSECVTRPNMSQVPTSMSIRKKSLFKIYFKMREHLLKNKVI